MTRQLCNYPKCTTMFEVPPYRGGAPRVRCDEHRGKRVPAEPKASAPEAAPETTMQDRTRAELDRLGALDTLDGVMLLQMADRMDRTREGSPYAAIVRTYTARLDLVRQQFAPKQATGDAVDQLGAARAARQASAR